MYFWCLIEKNFLHCFFMKFSRQTPSTWKFWLHLMWQRLEFFDGNILQFWESPLCFSITCWCFEDRSKSISLTVSSLHTCWSHGNKIYQKIIYINNFDSHFSKLSLMAIWEYHETLFEYELLSLMIANCSTNFFHYHEFW